MGQQLCLRTFQQSLAVKPVQHGGWEDANAAQNLKAVRLRACPVQVAPV